MKMLALFLTLTLLCSADQLKEQAVLKTALIELDHGMNDGAIKSLFRQYMQKYQKSYSPLEYETRLPIFVENVRSIMEHNQKNRITYTQGINQFTDLTAKEFKSQTNCYRQSNRTRRTVELPKTQIKSIDWTKRTCGDASCVTPVKNQAQCGSCWAFSATGCMEARTAIKYNRTAYQVSEQQLVDCSGAEGNYGCEGGLMDNAFKYIQMNGGLCGEKFYVYIAEDETCKTNFVKHCKVPHVYDGFYDIQKGDEEQLKAAVVQGPVSVAIEADQMIFQNYEGGVITGDCGDQLDHGVLVVGFGTMMISGEPVDYWKVKNSWTKHWGKDGYVLIGRNTGKPSGECGILSDPSYITFKSDASPKDKKE